MIKPLWGNIVVEPYIEENGKLIIPDAFKEKTGEGLVVYASKESIIQEGDEVVFEIDAGMEVTHEGKNYLLMGEESVLGIWQES